ncbi:NlpC/P60 family protein [Spongiactinospora sp. TRM90649]|uniref:C40 family peptidase n=1 Tax=Spongiactinospora sp. TRM90649 TaxID=3031114 RepID=UPI0023F82AB1|nr:NlpC/P60 family protein [Spongiactinospora sp. TRM90649]MDF5759013.1 NlpC/P60 family protein [Spongiactinospora sp. TRM90649]
MTQEAGLVPAIAVGGGLIAGVVLLAGMSAGAHYAIAPGAGVCGGGRQCGEEVMALAGRGLGVVAVQAALRMRGVPYSWGGGGPDGPSLGIGHGAATRGFDCSGLTEYAWSRVGVRIGGDTSAQWKAGVHVPRSQIRSGDLIFFAFNPASPATIHHVGLAIDATRMVHAPSTGSTVRVESWAGVPYREREFIGLVRPRHSAIRGPGSALSPKVRSWRPISAFL